jgi:hypothetical protein
MKRSIEEKPPGSSSSRVAEINSNTNERSITEKSEERKFKKWLVTIEAKGEILISSLPLQPEGWPRNFAKFGVTDGGIFINPDILSSWAGLSALISGVAIAIEDESVPILVPLSWAKAEYPQSREMLKDLEVAIRAIVFEIGEDQSHGR